MGEAHEYEERQKAWIDLRDSQETMLRYADRFIGRFRDLVRLWRKDWAIPGNSGDDYGDDYEDEED